MTKSPSRVIIVDACIARSASNSGRGPSSQCYGFLLTMRDICHKLGMSAEVKAEWDKHQSDAARQWRAEMCARRKFVAIREPVRVDVGALGLADREHKAVQKDEHLLGAALATDCNIATMDEDLKSALRSTTEGTKLLNRIIWHNPKTDGTSKL